jgi:uncharacterized phage protein (TIGR01671 family)
MREIKFRVYDKSKRKFIYYDYAAGFDNYKFWDIINDINHDGPKQYIGLKDINGKEIYEGDIIEMDFYHSKCRGEVVYFVNSYMIDTKQYHPDNLRSIYPNLIELIGNIYENPELLKQ